MSRRKIRQERSQLFGARQVVKSFNQPAHVQHHADEAVGGGTEVTIINASPSALPRLLSPTYDRFYLAGQWMNGRGPTSSTITLDTLYAVPFPTRGGVPIGTMAIHFPTVGGAGPYKFRLGIYAPTSVGDISPDALVWSSSEVSVSSTGVKTSAVAYTPEEGVYWAAIVANTSGGGGTYNIYVLDAASEVDPVLGTPSSSLASPPGTMLTAAHSYAALPSTFPAPTISTGNPPALGLQFTE